MKPNIQPLPNGGAMQQSPQNSGGTPLYQNVFPGDLTSPIDIQAVQTAVRAHGNLLVTLQTQTAAEILRHFTAMPGVHDSYTFGRTEVGSISRKYTGIFKGHVQNGKIVPRTLVVRPCVMEMADEPERYRRAYITAVAGGLNPQQHPFAIWLNNYGIQAASKDLHDVVLTAKYNANRDDLGSSFDGPLTILEQEIADGNISAAKGNLHATGELTRANIGTKLLEMFRALPTELRRQQVKMHMSVDLGDMYDDWLDDQGTLITGSGAETAGQKFLRGSGGKCELVRMTGMPEGCQFVWITVPENQYYGFDKTSDMNRILPFMSGNPYLYTAAGKYLMGFQFVSLDKTLLLCNDRPVVTYSAVETTTGKNPVNEGWFVLSSGKYVFSTDESPVNGTTYYVRNV